MNRINIYIFSQLVNSCTLVFFIFISIAWLLQLSRLFSIMSNLQINTLDILYLSLLIVPNLLSVTLPFIFIFGIVLAFVKFSRDREILAIYSLGLSINEIKKPILLIIGLFFFLSILLSFVFSPNSYSIYKEKEFKLRHLIEFNKINISNFIKFNENLIIDFENDNGVFKNILININEENDTIIYAKEGNIVQETDKLIFILNNGFKTEISNDNIENLKFDSYTSEFPIKQIRTYNNFDPNTLNIFDLLKENNNGQYLIIIHRIVDTIIILSIAIFFYFRIIKYNNFETSNIIFFIIISIICIALDNLLENFTSNNSGLLLLLFTNIFFIHLISFITKYFRFYA